MKKKRNNKEREKITSTEHQSWKRNPGIKSLLCKTKPFIIILFTCRWYQECKASGNLQGRWLKGLELSCRGLKSMTKQKAIQRSNPIQSIVGRPLYSFKMQCVSKAIRDRKWGRYSSQPDFSTTSIFTLEQKFSTGVTQEF